MSGGIETHTAPGDHISMLNQPNVQILAQNWRPALTAPSGATTPERQRKVLRPAFRGFTVFLIIWTGQLVSQIGSGLATLALGVWVYLQTGSVSRFAIVFLAGRVPATLIFPLAGALVDRLNRRSVIIACNFALALNSLVLIGLFWSNGLEVWNRTWRWPSPRLSAPSANRPIPP